MVAHPLISFRTTGLFAPGQKYLASRLAFHYYLGQSQVTQRNIFDDLPRLPRAGQPSVAQTYFHGFRRRRRWQPALAVLPLWDALS